MMVAVWHYTMNFLYVKKPVELIKLFMVTFSAVSK